MTEETDVGVESFHDFFLDSTNEGTRTVVEFPEVWKRRIREVQGTVRYQLSYHAVRSAR